MTEPSSESQREISKQEELESLWKNRDVWLDGMQVTMQGLPEGMRLLETDPHTLVLRSVLRGIPEDAQTRDVPVALFSTNMEPKELVGEAVKLTKSVLSGEVIFNGTVPQPK